jgi:hypothetical protein
MFEIGCKQWCVYLYVGTFNDKQSVYHIQQGLLFFLHQ